jgi:peptide deformylase
MIRELLDCNDPFLKQPVERFDFSNPPTDPLELAIDLAETCLHHNGLAIAATQVGLPYRVFVIRGEEIITCFNPTIVDQSAETIILEEGCLSFPGLFVKVKRPKKIKVRYTEPNGNTVTQVFDGFTARVFQHELDHLNGIVYTSRANRFHLEQARKRVKKPRPGDMVKAIAAAQKAGLIEDN